MIDEIGNVIEIQTKAIDVELRGEDSWSDTIIFSKTGYDVRVKYVSLNATNEDSKLSTLELSFIPFIFDNANELLTKNTYGVRLTQLTAIAKNPKAIIVINGVEYTDNAVAVAVADIALKEFDTVEVIIEVIINESKTKYVLEIASEAFRESAEVNISIDKRLAIKPVNREATNPSFSLYANAAVSGNLIVASYDASGRLVSMAMHEFSLAIYEETTVQASVAELAGGS